MKDARDQIVSALSGLTHACNNNPKTENTDDILLEAFRLYHSLKDMPAERAAAFAAMEADRIREEKFKIVPDCAVCKTPCGNTSDYDMEKFRAEPEETRGLKAELLEMAGELAMETLNEKISPERRQEILDFSCRAAAYAGWEMEKEDLMALKESAPAL